MGWGKHRHTDIYTEKLGSSGPCMPLWSCSNYTGTWNFSINYVQRRGVWCGVLTRIHRWAVSGYKHLGGGICGYQCLHTLLIFALEPKEGFAILLSLTWGVCVCLCQFPICLRRLDLAVPISTVHALRTSFTLYTFIQGIFCSHTFLLISFFSKVSSTVIDWLTQS